MIVAKQTCPRRIEDYAAIAEENQDGWEYRSDNLLWCTYCGSLQPNMLLSMMTTGVVLKPTDKNYKIYLSTAGHGQLGAFYFQHFSDEDKHQFVELFNQKPRPFTIGYPGHFYVLPFFMKLQGGENE